MNKRFEIIRQLWINYSVFVIMILFTFVAASISQCNMLDPVKFILIQVAFIYLPGYALQRLLCLSYQNSLVRGLISYATGYAISIAVYLVLLIIGIQKEIFYIYVAICLVSVTYLLLTQQIVNDELADIKDKKYFSVILLIALIISMVLFQFANLNPSLRQTNVSINQDLVFWMRNAVAATKSYPLPGLSVAGQTFFYHYFTSINLAFLKFTTNIEIFDLCFVYSYLITILLIVSGVYVACKELIVSWQLAFLTICFILFTQNFDQVTHIFFNDHLLTASFGLAEGMGMFFFTFYFYIRIIKSEKHHLSLLFMAMLMFFATSGLKAPLAAVLLVGIAVGSLNLMFFKNRFVYGTISGVALLSVFVITIGMFVINNIYAYIPDGTTMVPSDIQADVSNHSTSALSLSAVDTIFHSHFYERIYMLMVEIGLWKPVSYIIVFVLYLVSAILIPSMVCIITCKRRKLFDVDILIIAMIIAGLLLGMFVSQSGMSQGYFIYLSIPLIIIISMRGIRYEECDVMIVRKLTFVFVFGCVLFCVQKVNALHLSMSSMVRSFPIFTTLVERGYPLKEIAETGVTINKKEMIGLRWLRDHSPSDAIVLSNKVLSSEMGGRSFWVSSLTERQAFFESYDYSGIPSQIVKKKCDLINSFYTGDNNALFFLKKQRVSHAVVFNDIKPNSFPKGCNVVYKNEKITILEL